MEKYCKKCKETKDSIYYYNAKHNKDKLSSYCKICTNKANEIRRKSKLLKETKRGRKKKHPGEVGSKINRKSIALVRYGLTINDYNKMFIKQGGKCAICAKLELFLDKTLCIDHNHETGEVRALLCSSCNSALGLFKENIKSLQTAINYLKYYNKIP